MIAYLKGIVSEIGDGQMVIRCDHLGYELFVSANVIQRFSLGEEAALFTYLHVREDALELYGFLTGQEKALFQLLKTVSGIGPKSALAILGATTDTELAHAIIHENERFLTTLPGVGKKTASRMILELKDKVAHLALSGVETGTDSGIEPAGNDNFDSEVLAALQALGYTPFELKQVEKDILSQSTQTTEQGLLKEALAYLMKG